MFSRLNILIKRGNRKEKELQTIAMETTPSDSKESNPAKTPDESSSGSGTTGGGPWSKYSKRRGGSGYRGRRTTATNHPAPRPTNQVKFKGRCTDLEGHIFDVGPTQATQYMKTKNEITEYAGRTYGSTTRRSMEELKDMASILIVKPTEDPNAKGGEMELVKYRFRAYITEQVKYEQDMKKLYSVVHGQCTDAMKRKIQTQSGYQTVSDTSDSIGLMKIIKKICYNYQAEQYPPLSTVRALVKAFTFKQTDMMSDIEWSEEFDNTITAAEACGASFQFPGVVKHVLDADHSSLKLEQLDVAKQTEVMAKARTLALSTLYMENSNRNHYGVINQKLENDYLVGQDNYPKDLADAQKLLLNYKNDPKLSRSTTGNDGIAFAQQGQSGQREPDKSRITCYRCGKKGHYTYDNVCKQADVDANRKERDGNTEVTPATKTEPAETPGTATSQVSAQMLNLGLMDSFDDAPYQLMFCTMGEPHKETFTHRGANKKKADINYNNVLSQAKGKIDKDWLLLDNQSTVNVVCNPALLTNIRQIKQCMYIYCNAGMTSTNWVGDFEGYGTVWFHATGIANILSLALTKETHRIVYDSAADNIFYMYSQDGNRYREFRQSQRGLYYTDMKSSSVVLTINTVKENKTKFSNLDHRRAVKARKFQDIVNVPTKELLRVIDNKLMPNCPVTRDDVKVANAIFGPSIVGLKGKTVRRTEPHVREGEVQSMPPEIMTKYKNVTLGGDIMFVNKIRFFVTISRHIQFGTVEMISDAKAATLVQCIKSVMQAYSKRGFEVKQINMDLQFDPIKSDIEELHIDMNVVSEDEHVPEIERYIRTVKERVRGAQTTLPFPKLPGRMTVELVASCIFWLNVFPKIAGVSATLSPRTIITGNELDYKKHCTLQFGEYVHTHEKGTNSTAIPRSIGAIAMRPTGNAQGGFWFYSLKTGRRINRRRCTPMPMPDEAIDRINTLARRDPAGITFQDRNGVDIPDDDEDDDDYMPGLEHRDDDSDSDDDYSDDDSDDDDSDYDSDDDNDNNDNNSLDDNSSVNDDFPAHNNHNDDASDDEDADITGVNGEETEPGETENEATETETEPQNSP